MGVELDSASGTSFSKPGLDRLDALADGQRQAVRDAENMRVDGDDRLAETRY